MLEGEFLHWDGNRPYRPRLSGGSESHDRERAHRMLQNDPSEDVLDTMDTVAGHDYAHQMHGTSWPVIVILSLVAGVVLSLLIYALAGGLGPGTSARAKSVVKMQESISSDGSGSDKRFICCGIGRSRNEELVEEEFTEVVDDTATIRPVPIDEDTFGMSLCSMTRDVYFLCHEGRTVARYVRLLKSLFLLIATITLQVLLLSFSQFVAQRQVHEIRESYDLFEVTMYGKEHTTLTENGKHRGILVYQPPFEEAIKRLNSLSEDEKDMVCRIPLSQPLFFSLILLIWSLTCLSELRKAVEVQFHIMMLKTVPSMTLAMRQGEDKWEEEGDIIRGMTLYMKLLTLVIMFLPRVGITCYLLWVGCRWLLATTEFADLIMNAVALEFVLLIKEALYVALVSNRSHHDVTNTFFEHYPKTLAPEWYNFVHTLLLLAVACLWVFLYMYYFQRVLPEYNWDVHGVCVQYIKETYGT
jgi:hypothetical protein